MKNLISLLLWCGVSFSAGWFGSHFKPGPWYETLNKPGWTPPPLAFPIIWTTLYLLMGVAAWLVWKQRDANPFVRTALVFFILQLCLNAIWSWIFFGQHQLGWAFVNISALWVLIALTLASFWRVNTTAGLLFVPYLLWVSLAGVLNWSIWKNN